MAESQQTGVGLIGEDDYDPFEAFNRAMGASGDATPYPTFARLRAEAPVHPGVPDLGAVDYDESSTFTAYSYDAVHTILGDGETFSSAGYGEVMGVLMGRSILQMDEPEHHAYRSILQQAFTRTEMGRWEVELVGPLVNGMIDEFATDHRAELVGQLLFMFPVRVIAALLGLPEADLPRFHRLAVELIGATTVDWDRALAASAALRDYLAGIVDERRRSPAEDMISVLVGAEHEGQRLTDEEIFAFCRLLLPAGAETTYRSSSNLLFGLLTHPEQLQAVRADRSLVPLAIEEGIRWEPPLLIISRTATRDSEVCGVRIPAAASVVCSLGSANHDEARWPDAERFDIFRERRPHIGFAHGPHVCLGMHLARMETHVALAALLDRLPGLRLDPAAQAPYVSGRVFRAPPRLDVVWD
ncbi:MAG TPA: cytochrome P450 [Acidimicrobiales bacterium]|nr:cytochrome P450 [Acidimicrobiales bacterium]